MSDHKPILYSYWRSSCSWRCRIALELKGIQYEYRSVNLLKGEQQSAEYSALHPGKKVPCLVVGDEVITQSVAILEYLEEKYPDATPLLPKSPEHRALVRGMVQQIASDTQPLQNLGVLGYIGKHLGEETKQNWAKDVITNGLLAFQQQVIYAATKTQPAVDRENIRFSFGQQATLADLCLVPQMYNARRFGCDMSQFTVLERIEQNLQEMDAFKMASPDQMPDKM